MKTAFGTLNLGAIIPDIAMVLDAVADAGFDGIEIAQCPRNIGVDAETLWQLAEERGLEICGFLFGTIKERTDYWSGIPRPAYLYVEHGKDAVSQANLRDGLVLALHPGIFKSASRLADAEDLLRNNQTLKYLPDLAHLTIAGDDPVDAIRRLSTRIVAVHFKDWSPVFGRSCYRFSRGFTQLGTGKVPLEEVLSTLEELNYQGWLVAENDTLFDTFEEDAKRARNWFSEKGIAVKETADTASPRPRVEASPPVPSTFTSKRRREFRSRLLAATTLDLDQCFRETSLAIRELTGAEVVTVWAVSLAHGVMSLRASSTPAPLDDGRRLILYPCKKALSALAVENHRPFWSFDLTSEYFGRRYQKLDWLEDLNLSHLVSVPVYPVGNLSYSRLLVNILTSHPTPFNVSDATEISDAVAHATNASLERACSTAAVRVSLLSARQTDLKGFLNELVSLVRDELECEGVTVFCVDSSGKRLTVRGTTGIRWLIEDYRQQSYEQGENLTGGVWLRKEPCLKMFSWHDRFDDEKSEEIVPHKASNACLWVPLISPSTNEVLAVIRCRNRTSPFGKATGEMFSDEDAAVVDAIGQAALSHLQRGIEETTTVLRLGRLTHELKNPIQSVKGAAKSIQNTCDAPSRARELAGQIRSSCDLMLHHIRNSDLLRHWPEPLSLDRKTVDYQQVIFEPVVESLRWLLDVNGLSPKKIQWKSDVELPSLRIDIDLMQHAVRNILLNSIYFRSHEPDRFLIEVVAFDNVTNLSIRFRDFGIGIEDGAAEALFLPGVRSPRACQHLVAAQGVGLWAARRVVESHGGRVEFTASKNPTEVTISIPTRHGQHSGGRVWS